MKALDEKRREERQKEEKTENSKSSFGHSYCTSIWHEWSRKVNIIVATQVLEEGLDVPSCNLVVRFDPADNVCSFIQSRSSA